MGTFIAQVVLAALMIGLSLLGATSWQLPLILILAGAAAALAVIYPMRALEEKGTARIVITVAILLLVILILLTALDVGTREITEVPPRGQALFSPVSGPASEPGTVV